MEYSDPYKRLRTGIIATAIVIMTLVLLGICLMIILINEVKEKQIKDYNQKVAEGYTFVIDGRRSSAVLDAEYAIKHYDIKVDHITLLIYMNIKETSFARDLISTVRGEDADAVMETAAMEGGMLP